MPVRPWSNIPVGISMDTPRRAIDWTPDGSRHLAPVQDFANSTAMIPATHDARPSGRQLL
jgi:hypothetical protein